MIMKLIPILKQIYYKFIELTEIISFNLLRFMYLSSRMSL